MTHPGFTQEVMKIVPSDGHYDLLYRAGDGSIDVFARVPTHRHEQSETFSRAALLSASPLLLQALIDLLEYAQPDGWELRMEHDPDEGTAWHNAFVACAAAAGQTIAMEWISTAPGNPDGPSS